MDEMYVGGKPRGKDRAAFAATGSPRSAARKWADKNKTPVFGMVQRGGKVSAYVVASTQPPTLEGHIQARVLPEATIYADEAPAMWISLTVVDTNTVVSTTPRVFMSTATFTRTPWKASGP